MRSLIAALVVCLAAVTAQAQVHHSPQQAQRPNTHTTCSLGLDGGTTTSTETCPPINTAFMPVIETCGVTTLGSHLVGTVNLLVSTDGLTFASLPDGGYSFTFNQDVNTTSSAAFSFGPYVPWQAIESQVVLTINDGGTAGNAVFSCQQAYFH